MARADIPPLQALLLHGISCEATVVKMQHISSLRLGVNAEHRDPRLAREFLLLRARGCYRASPLYRTCNSFIRRVSSTTRSQPLRNAVARTILDQLPICKNSCKSGYSLFHPSTVSSATQQSTSPLKVARQFPSPTAISHSGFPAE